MSKLEEMLKYVSEHNEFYKNRIKEYGIKDPLDITQWPILTRKELQENRYNMFSDGYKSKYFNQQLRRQSSSGSSGVPVNVYWDYKDWYASNMSLWRKRLQWYGIHPSDKYVMFTLNAFNIKNDGETVYYINDPANILSVNVSLIQNESGYEKLVNIINDFEPKWLYIQPFVLNRLIQAYKRTGKIPPQTLKYIESVGELLASDLRRRAIEFFNVSLANMYGSEEMNGIAYECPQHHMHIHQDNVYLETTDNGEAIITNLNNFAMPLIRYEQGDYILCGTVNDDCLTDKNSNTIQIIKGRVLDTIMIGNEYELSSITLLEIIAEINNRFNDIIREYIYEYSRSKNILYLRLVIDENCVKWYDNIISSLKNLFCSKVLFSMEIQVERLDHILIKSQNRKNNIIKITEI